MSGCTGCGRCQTGRCGWCTGSRLGDGWRRLQGICGRCLWCRCVGWWHGRGWSGRRRRWHRCRCHGRWHRSRRRRPGRRRRGWRHRCRRIGWCKGRRMAGRSSRWSQHGHRQFVGGLRNRQEIAGAGGSRQQEGQHPRPYEEGQIYADEEGGSSHIRGSEWRPLHGPPSMSRSK